MKYFQDISIYPDNGYKLAESIASGKYSDMFYYEFHEVQHHLDSYFEGNRGHNDFIDWVSETNDIFLSYGYVDENPANIHVVVKLGDELFIARNCGSNFYTGYGPGGIKELREACKKMNVLSFSFDDNEITLDDWLQGKFGILESELKEESSLNRERIEFESIVKSIRHFVIDAQRRPKQFNIIGEEDIRDKMLTILNSQFEGRGNAEAKNNKGKTDILLKTKDSLNEHIFELKFWKGLNSFKATIDQLRDYLSWHNKHAGIVIFCNNKKYTHILKTVEKYLKEHHYYFKTNKYPESEFVFKILAPTDELRKVQVHALFVNLYQS